MFVIELTYHMTGLRRGHRNRRRLYLLPLETRREQIRFLLSRVASWRGTYLGQKILVDIDMLSGTIVDSYGVYFSIIQRLEDYSKNNIVERIM